MHVMLPQMIVTLAWMNDCNRNSSLHCCSMIPMYCSILLSVTPAWPPSSSVIAALSQLALLNSDSTPAMYKASTIAKKYLRK